MDLEYKINTLLKIAKVFNHNHLTWAVGASLLLYLKGKTNHFNDIDLMVVDEDALKMKKILCEMGTLLPTRPNGPKYQTKYFYEFMVDGVEIDVMGGFMIVKDGICHDCSLLAEQIDEYQMINDVQIPLHSLEVWKQYYEWMDRPNKAAMIKETNK